MEEIGNQGIKDYLEKMVVIELEKPGTPVVTGYLREYDGDFLEIGEYLQHVQSCTLPEILRNKGDLDSTTDPTNDDSKDYFIDSKYTNKSIVASIQRLDDVMR
jgi:hypothetical protein|tara:strand:- start:224 stop:532 length:309 start_codon:yes stop_codon:yes gene_type:complete